MILLNKCFKSNSQSDSLFVCHKKICKTLQRFASVSDFIYYSLSNLFGIKTHDLLKIGAHFVVLFEQ